MLQIDTRIAMNDGNSIPILGLGLYRSPAGKETYNSVKEALRVGYRHVDTARLYRNEKDVGQAIRDSGISREDIFVTTKLWNEDHGYSSAIQACEASLRQFGFDYVDLYLIHWPVQKKRIDSWRALVKLKQDGKCHSIGVSNYMSWHLEELFQTSDVIPVVNQFELSPFLTQPDLRELCHARGIVVEAYSPLTKGKRLKDKRLIEIARPYNKTPAQVLIRWAIQQRLVVLPKSNRPERIRENAAVFDFELSPSDMTRLNSMDENFRASWDPSNVP